MDPGNERFREVWGNTQDNLETAVGTAYSSWTDFQRAYLTPAYKSASSCLSQTVQNGLVCCFGSRMAAGRGHYYNSSRRDSFDIFYDMYDDEVYGRDELERLLSAHDDDVVFGGLADESDGEDGGGQAIRSERSKRRASRKGKGVHSESYVSEDNGDMVETNNAASQGGSRYFQHGMAVEPPIDSQPGLFNNSKTRLASFFNSIFPTKKPAHTVVSTVAAAGAAAAVRAPNRQRSSTKSSTQSSETFRSRTELFSDDADSALLEDAQMMSDNFAASLVFKSSGAESAKSISGEDDCGGAGGDVSSKRASSLHSAGEQLHFDEDDPEPVGEPKLSAVTPTLAPDSRVETHGKPLTDEELRREEEAVEREEEAHIESKRRAAKAKAKSLGLGLPATKVETEAAADVDAGEDERPQQQ